MSSDAFLAAHIVNGHVARDENGTEIYYPLNPNSTVCIAFKKTGRCPKFDPTGPMTCTFDHPNKAELWRRDMAELAKYKNEAGASRRIESDAKEQEAERRRKLVAEREAQRQEEKRIKAQQRAVALQASRTVKLTPTPILTPLWRCLRLRRRKRPNKPGGWRMRRIDTRLGCPDHTPPLCWSTRSDGARENPVD